MWAYGDGDHDKALGLARGPRYSAHIKFSTSADRTARGRWDARVAGSHSPVPLPQTGRNDPPSFLPADRALLRVTLPLGLVPMDCAPWRGSLMSCGKVG
jgi:hypothetical protein